jgi:uncharacterized coiled-coil DUF342 family protein
MEVHAMLQKEVQSLRNDRRLLKKHCKELTAQKDKAEAERHVLAEQLKQTRDVLEDAREHIQVLEQTAASASESAGKNAKTT